MDDLLTFYFSFKGRVTRYDFNIRYALVAFAGMIVAGLLDFFVINGGVLSSTMMEPFSNFWNFLIIVPTFAVICKRLHDMGYSGWWQLLVHGTCVGTIAIVIMIFGMAFFMNPLIAGASGLLALGALGIFYMVFFLALSLKRGTKGPNRFGADPLEVVNNDGK